MKLKMPRITQKHMLILLLVASVIQIAVVVSQVRRQRGGAACNYFIEKPSPMANTAYDGTVIATYAGEKMDDLYDRCRENCKCVGYDSTGNLFSALPDSGTGKDGVSTAIFWSRLSNDDNGSDDNGGKKKRKNGLSEWAKLGIAIGVFVIFVLAFALSAK